MQIQGLQKLEFKKFVKVEKKLNKNTELAKEVYEYFGKKIPFPRLMYMIKNWGYQYTYETFNECKKANIPALPLFLSKFKNKNCNIKWE